MNLVFCVALSGLSPVIAECVLQNKLLAIDREINNSTKAVSRHCFEVLQLLLRFSSPAVGRCHISFALFDSALITWYQQWFFTLRYARVAMVELIHKFGEMLNQSIECDLGIVPHRFQRISRRHNLTHASFRLFLSAIKRSACRHLRRDISYV